MTTFTPDLTDLSQAMAAVTVDQDSIPDLTPEFIADLFTEYHLIPFGRKYYESARSFCTHGTYGYYSKHLADSTFPRTLRSNGVVACAVGALSRKAGVSPMLIGRTDANSLHESIASTFRVPKVFVEGIDKGFTVADGVGSKLDAASIEEALSHDNADYQRGVRLGFAVWDELLRRAHAD